MVLEHTLETRIFQLDTAVKRQDFVRILAEPINANADETLGKNIVPDLFFSPESISNLEIGALEVQLGLGKSRDMQESLIWGPNGLAFLHIFLRNPLRDTTTITYVQEAVKELFETDLSDKLTQVYQDNLRLFGSNGKEFTSLSDGLRKNPRYDSPVYSRNVSYLKYYFNYIDSLITVLQQQAKAPCLQAIVTELQTILQETSLNTIKQILRKENHCFETQVQKNNNLKSDPHNYFYYKLADQLLQSSAVGTGDGVISLNELILDTLINLIIDEKQHIYRPYENSAIVHLDFLDSFLGYLNGIASYSKQISRQTATQYIFPEIANDGVIYFKDALHPFLVGKSAVPNDVSFNPTTSLHLVAGLNDGGKTTYEKMAGLLMLLTQIGAPIPAKDARITPVNHIYTLMNESGSVSKGSGDYVTLLRKIKYVLERAAVNDLVLFDEPTKGTSDEDALQPSLEIVGALQKIGCKTVYTTHLHQLQREVEANQILYNKVANYRVDVTAIQDDGTPTFSHKIVEGVAGTSYGVQIAKKVLDIRTVLSKRGL